MCLGKRRTGHLNRRKRAPEVPLSGALAAGHRCGRRARSPLAIT